MQRCEIVIEKSAILGEIEIPLFGPFYSASGRFIRRRVKLGIDYNRRDEQERERPTNKHDYASQLRRSK